jgi:hypothetical protein
VLGPIRQLDFQIRVWRRVELQQNFGALGVLRQVARSRPNFRLVRDAIGEARVGEVAQAISQLAEVNDDAFGLTNVPDQLIARTTLPWA